MERRSLDPVQSGQGWGGMWLKHIEAELGPACPVGSPMPSCLHPVPLEGKSRGQWPAAIGPHPRGAPAVSRARALAYPSLRNPR